MIISKNVTIGDTPTLIHKATSNGCFVYIAHANGGDSVTLGTANVTHNSGFTISGTGSGNAYLNGPLPPGDSIYGICASGATETIGVMIVEF